MPDYKFTVMCSSDEACPGVQRSMRPEYDSVARSYRDVDGDHYAIKKGITLAIAQKMSDDIYAKNKDAVLRVCVEELESNGVKIA